MQNRWENLDLLTSRALPDQKTKRTTLRKSRELVTKPACFGVFPVAVPYFPFKDLPGRLCRQIICHTNLKTYCFQNKENYRAEKLNKVSS